MTGRFEQALSEKKTPLWQRKEGKNPDGGLNVAGSKSAGVGRPVTKKPSKLKKGSKAANRRKSFCSRMGGMKKKLTSKKTASDPDSRINKALRKWNCSTDVNPNALQQMAEMVIEAMVDKKKPRVVKVADRNVRAGYAGQPRAMQKRRAAHDARRGVRKARGAEPQRASTEIVRNARQGLAEMILNAIQENDAFEAAKKAGKAKRRADAAAAAEEDKPKHTRRDSLELKGTVTPNQPDYLKKKLYNRPTKGSTMPGDNPGDTTEREPIQSIHRRGMTNKSAARQRRWARKQDRITKAADRAGSYADAEYKDILKGGDSDFN